MKTDGSKLEDYIYKIAKKYKQSSKESKIRVGKMVCCNTIKDLNYAFYGL